MKTVAMIPGIWLSGQSGPTPTPTPTPKKATDMIAAPTISNGRLPTLSTKRIEAVVVSQNETAFAAATNRAVSSGRPTLR